VAHIQILLTMLSLLGIALTFEKRLNIRFSTALLYGAIAISILLYIGALFNSLEITAVSIRIIGWVSLIAILHDLKNRKIKADEIYIIISAAGFYIYCQTEPYSIFPFVDDYSHWGRMSRYIAENNRLIINSDVIGMKNYPPIAALFHYFFTQLSGYQDNLAIFANGLLIIIFSSPLLNPISNYAAQEQKKAFILTSFSIYSFFWIFGLGLHSLWADLLLGFSFGIGLYLYFNEGGKDKNSALLVAVPLLLYIVQIKQIGILFAIFALVIMGLDYLKHDNKKLFIKVIILTGILFALFLFEWTWKNYLTLQDIAKADSSKITIIKILTAFNPDTASEKQAVIINNFIDYFLFSHHLSTFWFLVTMLLMGGIVAIKNMNKTNAYISAFISTYIFFLAYITVLLILYLFIFSEYDGPRLASIDRYTVTYILGILVFFGGTLLNVNSREKTKKYKIYLIAIAIIIIMPNAGRMVMDASRVALNLYPLHTAGKIGKLSQYIKQKTPENAKIYIIWSEGSDDESIVFSYFLMPRKINSSCIFIKPPHSIKGGDDVWSCALTLEQFEEKISSYDYLFLANPSDEFINFYANKLNIDYKQNSPALFKISNQNKLTLEKME